VKALAYLTAFHVGNVVKIRKIEIPADAQVMVPSDPVLHAFEQAFCWGQSDCQPVPGCYSVSTGDIVEVRVDGVVMRRMVEGCGFSDAMSEEQFKGFISDPDTVMHGYGMTKEVI